MIGLWKKCRACAAVWMVMMLAGVACADEPLLHMADLADASNWQIQGDDTARLRSVDDGFIELSFNPGKELKLLLKTPKAIPADAMDVTFLATNDGQQNTVVKLQVLVKDSTGAEFAYYTDSELYKTTDGEYGFTSRGHRASEVRHRTRGFLVPALNRYIRPLAGHQAPKGPLTWTGILVENRGQAKEGQLPALCLRDFSISTITPKNTSFYYQFDDNECFGEIDGLPHLTFGKFWWWDAHYRVVWSIRDRYDGQPFMTGHAQIHARDTDTAPHYTQIAKHLEIPVQEEGTYWVQVRVQRTDNNRHFKYYQRCEDFDYRLDVFKGKPAMSNRPMAERDELEFVRIAPQRATLTYRDGQAFIVPVELTLPRDDHFDPRQMTARVLVRSYGSGDQVLVQDIKPQWDDQGQYVFNVDMQDQKPGAYRMLVQLLEPNRQVYDIAHRLVSHVLPVEQEIKPIPDSVPSAKQLLASDKPMFHLDLTYENPMRIDQPEVAWEKGFKPCLDEAAKVSKFVEFAVDWSLVEPLPGVFDWQGIDRFVDAAYAKGLTVLLRLNFSSEGVPEWIDGDVMRTPDGYIYGHTAYLFHGMRVNYFASPRIKKAVNEFLMAAVARYRSHPGVHGYHYLSEHPGDAPWSGFFGGYSEQTIAAFIAYLQDRFKTVDAMNQSCHTSFTDWQTVYPPKGESGNDAKVDGTLPYRLVWLQFKDHIIQQAKREFVINARKIDPKRLLMLYATSEDLPWYVQQGCMTANGGTHDAHMSGYLTLAQAGLQMRNEEITPRAWSQEGPYQLDRSLFHASIAGPAHAHCKMFIAAGIPFEKRMNPPYSIGRYIQFQPLWEKLRLTEPVGPKVFSINSREDTFLRANGVGIGVTAGGWTMINYFASHTDIALGIDDNWQEAQVLLADGERIEMMMRDQVDKVVAYVRQGGTLVMGADAGRVCIQEPDKQWVLLNELGITIPTKDMRAGYRVAQAEIQKVDWGVPQGQNVKLRDTWDITETDSMQVLARFTDNKMPAITCQTVGKGKVVVIWARTIVPEIYGGISSIHGRLLDWLGVKRLADADSPRLWTHLLKHKSMPTWYGLVYAGPMNRPPDQNAVQGKVWWPGLPESGQYQITELITGQSLGTLSASELRLQGLPVNLQPQQVAFFSFQQQ